MIPDDERRPGVVSEAASEDRAKSLDIKVPQDGDARPTIPRYPVDSYSIALHPQHAAMLATSGISPSWASRRGYVTVDTKKLLNDLGITKGGQHVPGLLIPMRRKGGSQWGVQYRPDSPRLREGKEVKYETPIGQSNGIDVPPGVGPQLDDPSIPLFITEGVKKADAAAERGLCCIAIAGVWSWRGTNDKGGKTALGDWNDIALNGRKVNLAFDSDVTSKPSVRGALAALANYLTSRGARVKYLHLPDDGDGKTGLDDYLVGHTVEELKQLIRPEQPGSSHQDGDDSEPDHAHLDQERLDPTAQKALTAPPRSPVMAAEAFQGLPGRIVRAVEPYTEAGSAALLVTLLAAAGAMLGRESYVLAGDAEHAARLWPLIVGSTAGGMKGTSWAVIRRMVLAADRSFIENMDSGLSTGEGLIERVRDSKGYPDDKDFEEGIEDKRLLVVESEFAAVLGRGSRDGNSLSQIQRQAWDGSQLSTMTRKNRLRATGPHITIIAHITSTELRAKLSASDVSGGLMNRYLPIHSERSKKLPDSGTTPEDVVAALGKQLADALADAKSHAGSVGRDQQAADLWRRMYDELTPDVPDGPIAAVIARAVPQVLRLSLVYALLDEQEDRAAVLRVEHLTAARAVWRYVEASARRIFGDMEGNRDMVKVATAVDAASDGLTRNDIRDVIGRHKNRGELDEILRQLLLTGRYAEVTEPGRGRWPTRYRAVCGSDQRDKRGKRDKEVNDAVALMLPRDDDEDTAHTALAAPSGIDSASQPETTSPTALTVPQTDEPPLDATATSQNGASAFYAPPSFHRASIPVNAPILHHQL